MTSRGVFVENRLRHLLEDTDIQSQVVAPIPWFPFSKYVNDEYREYSRAPYKETRYGISITHPRYLHLPKVGMTLQPFFMAISALSVIKKMIKNGYDFDLIDAHYFYPDGVAAALLARWLHKPFVVTARGTDLNLIPRYTLPRKLIHYAATKASGLITVCRALKDVLVEMGVDDGKIVPLRNGVDLQMFRPPEDRETLRKKLGITGKTLLSVGYLIERKGHNFTIEALKYLPDVTLLIAGTGPEQKNLQAQIQALGLAERVKLLGSVSHERLKDYYGTVDIMVLASSREGWANVLLESMACGTPVVATDIWGTPEVVACPEAGVLVQRNASSIADGVTRLFDNYPDRTLTRKYAERFSWHETSLGQKDMFASVVRS
jgi:glycosyltransferase involved in cell wall biosynthesis